MTAALRLVGVTKSYGRNVALRGLDLEVPRGAVCGLVGPNGAGKTTTFGIISGVLTADSGEVDLLGSGRFSPRTHRGRVTLLPQDSDLNPHTPVRDLLRFFGMLQGLTRAKAASEAERVLELVDLRERGGERIRQLSHGMRRRVSVAQALLGEPELVLLDEPTAGLDPVQVVRLRELFQAQAGKRTLIISSHILSELEAACDHVIIMDRGVVKTQGPMIEVTGRRSQVHFTLGAPAPLDALRAALPSVDVQGTDDGLMLLAPPELGVAELNAVALRVLLDHKVPVLELRRGQSLERTVLG